MTRRSRFLAVLLLILVPLQAQAWGIKHELRNPAALRTSLVSKVLTQHRLAYCLEIAPDAAPALQQDSTLASELESALVLWLAQLNLQKAPEISRVTCTAAPDLKVTVTADGQTGDSHGSWTLVMLPDGNTPGYVHITIDSNFIWHETRGLPGNANGDYHWHTIAALIPGPVKKTASTLAVARLSVDAVASMLGQAHSAVFWTSYRVFIHELGHAFGLCDTDPALLSSQCDSRWQSSQQPASVMNGSNFFYITDDDATGLKALQMLATTSQP